MPVQTKAPAHFKDATDRHREIKEACKPYFDAALTLACTAHKCGLNPVPIIIDDPAGHLSEQAEFQTIKEGVRACVLDLPAAVNFLRDSEQDSNARTLAQGVQDRSSTPTLSTLYVVHLTDEGCHVIHASDD